MRKTEAFLGACAIFLYGTLWSVLWPLCLGLLANPPAKNRVLAELLMFLFPLTIFPNFFFLFQWGWIFPLFQVVGMIQCYDFEEPWSTLFIVIRQKNSRSKSSTPVNHYSWMFLGKPHADLSEFYKSSTVCWSTPKS